MENFRSRTQKILIVLGAAQTIAANFPALANLVPAAQVLTLAAGVTTARMNIAHGLGFRPALHCVRVIWVGADTDAQAAVALGVANTTTTTIGVKASAAQAAAEAAFLVIIDLDQDIGGRYPSNQ